METIVSHYIRIDFKPEGGFEVRIVEETFDLGKYNADQLAWARDCPKNRHGVRSKMRWSDEEFEKPEHNSVILGHFIEMHGADWFRDNLRPMHIRIRSKVVSEVNPNCFLTRVHEHCNKCPECLVAKNGTVVE